MTLWMGLIVYSLCWWMIWFMLLPIGIRTQAEEGKVVPGTPKSAPVKPMLWKKAGATTVIAALVTGLIYYLIVTG